MINGQNKLRSLQKNKMINLGLLSYAEQNFDFIQFLATESSIITLWLSWSQEIKSVNPKANQS